VNLSYVKQGLIDGNYLCKYKIVDFYISPKYVDLNSGDNKNHQKNYEKNN